MNEQEKFFVEELIRHARSLPFEDCLNFLTGAVTSLGSDHPARERLILAQRNLTDCDAQFDLIAVGQLKFNLGGEA